jgi:hypothetical protein
LHPHHERLYPAAACSHHTLHICHESAFYTESNPRAARLGPSIVGPAQGRDVKIRVPRARVSSLVQFFPRCRNSSQQRFN